MADTRSLLDNTEFILDLARYADGLTTETEVRKKYRLPEDVWQGLANDEELVAAIEAEKAKRIRNGTSARERAQQLFATAPTVLGKILNDDAQSARHRIESAKELRTIAANSGPEAAPDSSERFSIVINLGNDLKLKVDKELGMVPHDGETLDHDADTAPQLLTAISAKKDSDDGSRGGAW